MTKKYCNSLVNRIFPTWLLQSNSPTATSQGWAQSNTSMWSHDQKNISIDQFRYIILGGNDNLFWSQPPPPIYPNILHNIVTLVEKHRIIDKNKYETTQKLIYRKLYIGVLIPFSVGVCYILELNKRGFMKGGGETKKGNRPITKYRLLGGSKIYFFGRKLRRHHTQKNLRKIYHDV